MTGVMLFVGFGCGFIAAMLIVFFCYKIRDADYTNDFEKYRKEVNAQLVELKSQLGGKELSKAEQDKIRYAQEQIDMINDYKG